MPPLPTGTLTFLFTDIEGSTQRWEHQREAMSAALVRHDALVRGAIEAHGGHVFKTVGDAYCAAFAHAHAHDAQNTLAAEPWSTFGAGVEQALDEQWQPKRETEPRFWQDERFNKPAQPVGGVCWYEARAKTMMRYRRTGTPATPRTGATMPLRHKMCVAGWRVEL